MTKSDKNSDSKEASIKPVGSLAKNLEQKLAAERQKTEQIYKQELNKLRNNLARESQNVFHSIQSDTNLLQHRVNRFYKMSLIIPAASVMSLLIAFFSVSFLMTRSLASLAQQIQQQKQTIELLKNQSWQVELYQNSNNEKYLILPANYPEQTDWICKGRPCIKL